MEKILRKWSLLAAAAFALLLSVLMPVCADAASAPGTPYLESVKLAAYNAARIEWQEVSGATAYQVYCRVNGGPYTWVRTTTSNAIVHKKLRGGATYYYKVRALKGNKKGAFSRSLPLLTISTSKPALTASVDRTRVTLKWKAVKNATGYAVYRKTSKGKNILVKSTKKLTYESSGLDLYTRYTFIVRPYRVNNGRRFYGKGASIAAVTSRTGYFMDLLKPYETSTPMFQAYKNYSDKTFYMAGDPYTHGMLLETIGYAVYNLHGRYKKLTLTIGSVDHTVNPQRNRYICFYGDDVLLKKLFIKGTALPASYTVNLTGVTKFKIAEEGTGVLGGTTGLADILISR